MKNFLNRLIQLGQFDGQDALDKSRVMIINWFVLVAIFIAIFFLIVNLVLEIYLQSIISVSAIILLAPTFAFNANKKINLATLYFLSACSLIVILSSFVSYQEQRFTEVENILFVIMVLSVFLLDGMKSVFSFCLVLIIFLVLKTISAVSQGNTVETNLILLLITAALISISLNVFAQLFKRILFKSYDRLNEQKNLLYTLIDNIPLYIGIFDENGRYSMVNINYEKTFQLKREEIIGKRLRDIIPSENIPKYEPLLNRALNGESVEFHLETPLKNGSTIFAKGKYVPIKSDDGKVKYVTVALFDVTDLELVKKQLEEANQSKNRLINIIAHDIRNPLFDFDLILNSSSEGDLSKEKFTYFVDLIKSKFEPLKSTIHGLLDWSISQMHGIVLNPQQFRLDELLLEILESLKNHLDKKSITIDLRLNDAVIINADRENLKIVFRNIIHNAIKFTPEGERIIVELKMGEKEALVNIIDKGVGMPKELIDKILTKQVVNSTMGTSGEKGSGIGLSFCVDLLEKNKGTLAIQSKVGEGSTFKIVLPLGEAIAKN